MSFVDGPAGRFLLLCLRGRFDPGKLEEARGLAERELVEWEKVERLVWGGALGSLLYSIVRGRELLPPAFEATLQDVYLANAARNSFLLHELSQVGGRLAAAGIPMLALKGASLAEEVYGNAALRPMRDLDILVPRGDARRAVEIIQANGYNAIDPEVRGGMGLAYENELRLLKEALVFTCVEVHWHLLDSPFYQFGMDLEWFWESARPRTSDGAVGLMLGPEALLLYLCAHLALHHRRGRILWLHDVAEVLHRYEEELDWDSVLQRAEDYNLVMPLQQIVPEVAEGWQVSLPDGVGERVVGLQPSAHERNVYSEMTADFRPVVRRFWGDLASIPGWSGRFRYGWSHLFPSTSYLRQRYEVRHDAFLPFYYLYRWYVGIREVVRR